MKKPGIKIGLKTPHPGDFIRTEVVEELGLSVAQAAEILGVDSTNLSELLLGDRPLTAEMALRFEKAFGLGMDLMLRIQARYEAEQMRERANEIHVEPYLPAFAGKGVE